MVLEKRKMFEVKQEVKNRNKKDKSRTTTTGEKREMKERGEKREIGKGENREDLTVSKEKKIKETRNFKLGNTKKQTYISTTRVTRNVANFDFEKYLKQGESEGLLVKHQSHLPDGGGNYWEGGKNAPESRKQ